jgi:hypothetical protein
MVVAPLNSAISLCTYCILLPIDRGNSNLGIKLILLSKKIGLIPEELNDYINCRSGAFNFRISKTISDRFLEIEIGEVKAGFTDFITIAYQSRCC